MRRIRERADGFANYATEAINLPEFLPTKLMTEAEFGGPPHRLGMFGIE